MTTTVERRVRRLLRPAKRGLDWLKLETEARHVSRSAGVDLAIFHEFTPPPSGGGNQFLYSLKRELECRGVTIETNVISRSTMHCLFNSYNFDERRLERFARRGVRMVHRVDGPTGVYRGIDDGTDDRIAAINRLADATIFQSRFSLDKHRELGYELADPHIIPNAVDPTIFNATGRAPFSRERPLRLVSTSWSDNPRKGGAVYRRLAETLPRERYDMLFVGRSAEPIPGMRPSVASDELASILRSRDVYIAASQDDPCSNAVLEALACGLPVLYRRSGGHTEIVGDAGFGWDDPDEIPELLELIVSEYEERQASISIATLSDVADRYAAVLQLDAAADGSAPPAQRRRSRS